ncbi:MAG TPA: CDP-glycerol glycerophosphotransferase family protein [Candidatus Saccharimonadales bacterium]|nr:CDP-glycerol glycerophosphotransferase family protein [Candidatus Saccharimonadales bacterium]
MFFRKQPSPTVNYDAYNKQWYFGFLDEWQQKLSTEQPSLETQIEYLTELSVRLKVNTNNANLRLLNETELKKFWAGVKQNLQHIDESTIIDEAYFYNSPLKKFLLEMRSGDLRTTYKTDDIILKTANGTFFTRASQRDVFVELMSYDKARNRLLIIGCTTFPLDLKTTTLVVDINGKQTTLNDSGLYSDFKIFGQTIYHKYPYRIEVDLNKDVPLNLGFYLVSRRHGTKVGLNLHFNTRMSKLAGRITYWRFSKYLATHSKKTLLVKNNNPLEVLIRELIFLSAMSTLWRRPRTAVLRCLYWVVKPVLGRRNIWMYADKIYKAGDNAEWLYRYAVKQQDGIHHYYLLRDDSPDAEVFKQDGIPYLKYKTIWQRLLFLHANVIVFTHNNAPGYYRFAKANEVFFRNLYNYDIMYVQHGLTVQDTAWLFKKSEDDFKQFFVASKFETENLLRPEYGFKRQEIVPAGATRYDGLINNDQKNIIITPTWRTYLAPPGRDYGESRSSHELFKHSDFYKIYSALITDKQLIATAKRLGYSITYLLHPVMSSQISDFDQSGFVKILTANDDFNYQKAMTEASLMVTDYSGVQFDFAYMYKPVIYFHPPALPASYDEAIYQYGKHALGEITTKVDELVALMCEYMENECKIKSKYKKRIDEFFYFHDHKNSQRTYNQIIKWQRNNP